MPIRIFTIPFDTDKELFHDEQLVEFLLNKRILRLHPEFFQKDGSVYWTVFVEYETVIGGDKDAGIERLNEPQKLLFKRLREWRKNKSEKEGVPVFIIATNKQLAEVVLKAPSTLASLREIHGFGKKKIERYGNEVTGIIKAFYEKQPPGRKDERES
jgi:superfamily II DNA helicase RecQ